jgi:hypothetical protein
LNDWYSIPKGVDNAADVLMDAFSYYCEWDAEDEKQKLLPIVGPASLPARTQPLSDEMRKTITEYLAENQKTLTLLHKGAAIRRCRYPVDLTKGLRTLAPYLPEIRRGAFVLELEAILNAENSEPNLAVQSITSVFGLARSLSKEPLLVSQLVRIACNAIGVRSLERVVNRIVLTDTQLRHLSQILANAQDLSAMSRAFAGERCMGIDVFQRRLSETLPFFGHSAGLSTYLLVLCQAAGLGDVDTLVYLNLMAGYVEANQLPLHQRKKAAEAIEARLKSTSKIHVLLHIFKPPASRVTTVDIRAIAQLRTAQLVLAIERYRLTTGGFPGNLADLVPTYIDAIPKDPFDGKDLRCKELDTGYVVYSVGEDLTDDGGKEQQSKIRKMPTDVTFIVER